jgi:hypothetical protein
MSRAALLTTSRGPSPATSPGGSTPPCADLKSRTRDGCAAPPPDPPGVQPPTKDGKSWCRTEPQPPSHRKLNTPRDASAGLFGNPGVIDTLTHTVPWSVNRYLQRPTWAVTRKPESSHAGPPTISALHGRVGTFRAIAEEPSAPLHDEPADPTGQLRGAAVLPPRRPLALLRKDILKPTEHYVERSSIYSAQPLHQTVPIKRADLVEQDQACLPLEAHMDPERR